ncbi:tetratricopeptide repeat protein [Parvibaculum sp.]|uniref:tetratricopeptide repeat protein n=1 Tax=Parvibaculum sp. TaxID=2024848 RepID=UPI001B1C1106|nr:tetratricopeptide repeat protein [Parvibaculum sp.]MBO6635713.1 sel1 repeat family protein [Parvibaculum sp.]MBO6678510.1 sel1 repeat family protein [Parvibaculum sp.]MBO6685117.1 sel1 repeat family protein [Parvibaculum sp.]
MGSYRSAPLFAALFGVLVITSFPATVRGESGVGVQELIEQSGPTEEQQAVQFNKGLISYDHGDYTRAFEFWLPLAQTDDLAAMRNVALLLKEGKGVEKDPERALYFFERAGRAGLVSAQVNAAFMYLNGEGTPQDYKTASFWFHAAAVAGVPAARYNLAVMYEKGLGVERDPARALAWYALAARVGHETALERLTQLVPSLPGPPPPSEEDAGLSLTAPPPPPAEIDTMEGPAP